MTRRNFLLGSIGLSLTAKLLSQNTSVVWPTPPVSQPPPSLDRSRFLDCVAEIESGGNDSAIGPCGSRSRYQLSQAVWRQHTSRPFTSCRGPQARAVAEMHLDWLLSNLPEPSVYWAAFAWRVGLRATKLIYNGDKTHVDCTYAQRVSLLYYAYGAN